MKQLLFFFLMVHQVGYGQISLEHSYSNAGHYAVDATLQQLYVVQLEVDGDKYLFADKQNKELKFYNLNHTLWKTIDFSQATDLNPNANAQNITYVSQYLI